MAGVSGMLGVEDTVGRQADRRTYNIEDFLSDVVNAVATRQSALKAPSVAIMEFRRLVAPLNVGRLIDDAVPSEIKTIDN